MTLPRPYEDEDSIRAPGLGSNPPKPTRAGSAMPVGQGRSRLAVARAAPFTTFRNKPENPRSVSEDIMAGEVSSPAAEERCTRMQE